MQIITFTTTALIYALMPDIFFGLIVQRQREGLKTTPNSECALNALAIDNPLVYARLYLDGTMQMWVDAEDSLEVW